MQTPGEFVWYCTESSTNLSIWGMGPIETVQVEEEPIALSLFREGSTRERSTREPDKDQALLALARPTSGRRRTEAVPAHYNEESSEQESSPEPEHYRRSTSPVKRTPCLLSKEAKYETSPERMRTSSMQRPKSAAVKKVYYFCGPRHWWCEGFKVCLVWSFFGLIGLDVLPNIFVVLIYWHPSSINSFGWLLIHAVSLILNNCCPSSFRQLTLHRLSWLELCLGNYIIFIS